MIKVRIKMLMRFSGVGCCMCRFQRKRRWVRLGISYSHTHWQRRCLAMVDITSYVLEDLNTLDDFQDIIHICS